MGRPVRLRIYTTDPRHAATFYTGGFRMVAARRRRSALLGDHTQQRLGIDGTDPIDADANGPFITISGATPC
jgi:hypothetical protein